MTSIFLEQLEKQAKEYDSKDVLRESIITNARKVQKESKQAIYALHRNSTSTYKEKITLATTHVQQALQSIQNNDWRINDVGAFKASLEEFLEAKGLYHVITFNTLPTIDNLEAREFGTQIYLQAMADVSGELVRHATIAATNKEYDTVMMCRSLISEVYEGFLQFDFRGGELRKKSDSVRHNLNKIELIVYDVSIRK